MITFSEFKTSKPNNNLLTRFEKLSEYMSDIFEMPCYIIGLHSNLKQDLLGKDQEIKNVTPRLVLEFTNFNIQRNEVTNMQATTEFDAYNDKGTLGPIGIPYISLPIKSDFSMTFVVDNVKQAIEITEYLALLSILIPDVPGDQYSKSIIQFDINGRIQRDDKRPDILVTSSMSLFARIPEPVQNSMTNGENTLKSYEWWKNQENIEQPERDANGNIVPPNWPKDENGNPLPVPPNLPGYNTGETIPNIDHDMQHDIQDSKSKFENDTPDCRRTYPLNIEKPN